MSPLHPPRLAALLCTLALLPISAPASEALPYASVCDAEGNVPDSEVLGEALLSHPEVLNPVYEDAQRKAPRAVKCWQQLEALYQGVGRGMADVASSPRCVLADVLPYCRPGGEAFELLSNAGPGGERLKALAMAAFNERMQQLHPQRVVIGSAANLAMAGSLVGKQLAGAKAAEVGELSELKQEARVGASAEALALTELEEALPPEALEARLASAEAAETNGRMTADLGTLERLRPVAERPPQGTQVGNKLWGQYVRYWEQRFGEMVQQQRAAKPSATPVKPPLTWDAYRPFRQRFINSLKFQHDFTVRLRADAALPREKRIHTKDFVEPLVEENVGVSKGKGTNFADQLVSEKRPAPGQPRRVYTFSVKQRNLLNLSADELESVIQTDVNEAWTQYGGTLEVRRPGHPLFEEQVQVNKIHLIYDAKFKPPQPVLDKALRQVNNPGVAILFR